MAEERGTVPGAELGGAEKGAAEAIISLAEAAAKLKESGLLDMLTTMAERYEELLLYTNEHRVYHALALAEAFLNGVGKADPWKAKPAVEMLTSCTLEALDPQLLRSAPPIRGVFSLLKALSDPDIAKGLGALFAVAKRLGSCLRAMEEQGAGGSH